MTGRFAISIATARRMAGHAPSTRSYSRPNIHGAAVPPFELLAQRVSGVFWQRAEHDEPGTAAIEAIFEDPEWSFCLWRRVVAGEHAVRPLKFNADLAAPLPWQ